MTKEQDWSMWGDSDDGIVWADRRLTFDQEKQIKVGDAIPYPHGGGAIVIMRIYHERVREYDFVAEGYFEPGWVAMEPLR